ncbi:MAG: hypothetical protein KGM44_06850, partial [bacterium]|nr:hypothetical protein [bacterium]
ATTPEPPTRNVLPQFAPAARSAAAAPAGTAPAPASSTPAAGVLRTLRIPVTPTTLAAARIALQGRVPLSSALDALRRALPQGSDDPRVRQLRAIAEFVGTLDPAKPEVLPARIEAYLDHVLGQEAHLRQALAPPPANASSLPPEVGASRIAVAREAVAANLKTQVMALLADSGSTGTGGAAAAGRAALQSALTAITATQIQTLSVQTANPQTANPQTAGPQTAGPQTAGPQTANVQALVIPLPLPFPAGGQQAQLRIERDAGKAGEPITADRFRVALILDTARHGTVAIEVLCADRALSVDVKAERASAAAAFERHLPELGARLERLAYRVVRLGAGVAPLGPPPESSSAPAAQEQRSGSAWDLHA